MKDGFRKHLEAKDSSASAIKSYLADVEKFYRWCKETQGEDPEPGYIGPMDMAEFKRHLLNRGQKPATINRAIVALAAFFRWAGVPDPTEKTKPVGQTRAGLPGPWI